MMCGMVEDKVTVSKYERHLWRKVSIKAVLKMFVFESILPADFVENEFHKEWVVALF